MEQLISAGDEDGTARPVVSTLVNALVDGVQPISLSNPSRRATARNLCRQPVTRKRTNFG